VEKVSFEPGMNSECVMEGESGAQVGGELESMTSSAGCFMQVHSPLYLMCVRSYAHYIMLRERKSGDFM